MVQICGRAGFPPSGAARPTAGRWTFVRAPSYNGNAPRLEPTPVIRLSAVTLAVILGRLHVPDAGAQRPDDELTWRRRAVAAMAAGDFDAAVAAADRAQAIAPDRSAVQLVVGQAYLSHARDRPSLGAIGKVKKG